MMKIPEGVVYDPETITVLKDVLETAWDSLPQEQRSEISKTELASRILKAAADGERDPVRLRATALISAVG